MRRFSLLAVAAWLPWLLILPSLASAGQDNPATLAHQYTQSMQAKDYAGAVTAAQQLVALNPTAENLRLLAEAQLYSHAAQDSLATYDRALAAAAREKPAPGQPDAAWKDEMAKLYLGKGNALYKLHREPEALEAYNHSAEFAANPAKAYFNACAMLYNTGKTQGAVETCRKCLKADPSKADAWFILGSMLFINAAPDAQGKFVISAETRQALEKYLELAPDGPHAPDVKAMLDMAAK